MSVIKLGKLLSNSDTVILKVLTEWKDSCHDDVEKFFRNSMIERIFEKISTPRTPGGILSDVYEWDLIPPDAKINTIRNLFTDEVCGWNSIKCLLIGKMKNIPEMETLMRHIPSCNI